LIVLALVLPRCGCCASSAFVEIGRLSRASGTLRGARLGHAGPRMQRGAEVLDTVTLPLGGGADQNVLHRCAQFHVRTENL
jgi:hypothetical protein